MSDPRGPETRRDPAPSSTDIERPRWMMTVAITMMVLAPVVGQILVEHTDLRAFAYPFSWTMYSR